MCGIVAHIEHQQVSFCTKLIVLIVSLMDECHHSSLVLRYLLPVDSSYQIPCTGSLLQQWQQYFLNENHEPEKAIGLTYFFVCLYLHLLWETSAIMCQNLGCPGSGKNNFVVIMPLHICIPPVHCNLSSVKEWQDTAEQVVECVTQLCRGAQKQWKGSCPIL